MNSPDDPTRPNPEIVDAALEQQEAEGAVSRRQLLERFPGREADVDRAIAATERYARLLQDAQQRRTAGPDVLPEGATVGDFVVSGLLGRGNMGVVYRASQQSLGGREVALKVLPTALVARDPTSYERFRREAESASRLEHESIASVYGSGTVEGLSYFAMQLIEGRTLAEVLAGLALQQQLGSQQHLQRPFVLQVVRLVRDIADALAAIHENGLIHRDVKPTNIILRGASSDDFAALRSKPVLVDFGLVRPIEGSELTDPLTLVGTPAYAPPEVHPHRKVDASADVYSLGVVLHDLLSLTRAGARSPASAGMRSVQALNPRVDDRLAAIVEMSLQEQPNLRYADGAAFRDELDRYLRGKPLVAKPETRLGRLRLWARREPTRALRLSFLLLALAPVVIGPMGCVTYLATDSYSLAAEVREHERAGDLVRARDAALALSRRERLARHLPYLTDDLENAAAYEGPVGDLLSSFRGPGGLANDERLREAHARVQGFMLNRPQDAWDSRLLAFLAREIAADDEQSELRRQLAAESASAYLVVHPLRSGWASSTSPGTSSPGAATELPREAWLSLRAALLDAAAPTSGGEPSLRRHAIAALSGVTDPLVLEHLVRLMRDSDVEIKRLASHAIIRQWWQLELDARGAPPSSGSAPFGATLEADLPDELLRAWADSAYNTEEDQDFDLSLREPAYLIAWTGLRRGHTHLDDEVWSELAPKDRQHILQVQAVFRTVLQDTRSDPVPISCIREPRFDREWFAMTPGPEGTAPGLSRREFNAKWRPESHPWAYHDIWNQEEPSKGKADSAAVLEPQTDRGGLYFRIEEETGEPIAVLFGCAKAASWSGATPEVDSTFTYLRFDMVGGNGLSFRFRPPSMDDGQGLRVSMVQRRAARYYIPDKGRAWIQVSLGGGDVLAAFAAPLGRYESSFVIDGSLLPEGDEAEVELNIRLVAGTTTYRLARLEIEKVEVLRPE